MKVLCIAGSPSPAAWSYQLLKAVMDTLAERGAEIDLLDLRTVEVPLLDTVAYNANLPFAHATGRDLRARVATADAVVLSTSVHHASYSGLLKSALDHLAADAFVDKAVGLLANAGAARGATIACEHLRSVVKAMGGWSTPTQVATSSSDFDAEARTLTSAAMQRRCAVLGDELCRFTSAMRPGSWR